MNFLGRLQGLRGKGRAAFVYALRPKGITARGSTSDPGALHRNNGADKDQAVVK